MFHAFLAHDNCYKSTHVFACALGNWINDHYLYAVKLAFSFAISESSFVKLLETWSHGFQVLLDILLLVYQCKQFCSKIRPSFQVYIVFNIEA